MNLAQIKQSSKYLVAASVLGVAAVTGVYATDAYAGKSDHNQALQAMESGQIKPLTDILEIVSKKVPGRVIEVELDRKHSEWVYKVKLIENGGLVRKLKVDANTGEIVRNKIDD